MELCYIHIQTALFLEYILRTHSNLPIFLEQILCTYSNRFIFLEQTLHTHSNRSIFFEQMLHTHSNGFIFFNKCYILLQMGLYVFLEQMLHKHSNGFILLEQILHTLSNGFIFLERMLGITFKLLNFVLLQWVITILLPRALALWNMTWFFLLLLFCYQQSLKSKAIWSNCCWRTVSGIAQRPAIRIHTMSLTERVSRKPNTILPFPITCFLLKILRPVVQKLSCSYHRSSACYFTTIYISNVWQSHKVEPACLFHLYRISVN